MYISNNITNAAHLQELSIVEEHPCKCTGKHYPLQPKVPHQRHALQPNMGTFKHGLFKHGPYTLVNKDIPDQVHAECYVNKTFRTLTL